MNQCGCHKAINSHVARKTLILALALNLIMFIVGLIAGVLAQSTGLLADALDMLADASAYAIGLLALKRDIHFKTIAARASGFLLLLLGLLVLFDITEKAWYGSAPNSIIMVVVAFVSLVVNGTVMLKLGQLKNEGVHLRATWIFTKADVIANIGVLVSAGLVALSHSHYPDLVIGLIVSLYIVKQAFEIIKSTYYEK